MKLAKAERQQAHEQQAAALHAKESYESGVNAIDTVLTEAENETLNYDPDTGQTKMKDPKPVKAAPPKLREQIVKLAR